MRSVRFMRTYLAFPNRNHVFATSRTTTGTNCAMGKRERVTRCGSSFSHVAVLDCSRTAHLRCPRNVLLTSYPGRDSARFLWRASVRYDRNRRMTEQHGHEATAVVRFVFFARRVFFSFWALAGVCQRRRGQVNCVIHHHHHMYHQRRGRVCATDSPSDQPTVFTT